MSDEQISLLLIEALEHNAIIVSLASLYYGNCKDNPRLAEVASRQLNEAMNNHKEKIEEILGKGEK